MMDCTVCKRPLDPYSHRRDVCSPAHHLYCRRWVSWLSGKKEARSGQEGQEGKAAGGPMGHQEE